MFFWVALFFILGEFILPKEIKSDTHFELFEVPWKMICQDGTTMDIKIPGICPADRNEIVTVETVLPEDIKENLFLCFRSNRQDMELYVDNELRQSYSTEKKQSLWSFQSGSIYLFENKGRGWWENPSCNLSDRYSLQRKFYRKFFMGILWGFGAFNSKKEAMN